MPIKPYHACTCQHVHFIASVAEKLDEHLARVLSELWRRNVGIEDSLAQMDGTLNSLYIAGTGVRHLGNHAPRSQHFAVADLADCSNGSTRHITLIEDFEPFVARALLNNRSYDRKQGIAVTNSVWRTRKSSVLREFCRTNSRTEATPYTIIRDAEVDPAIGGLESLVRNNGVRRPSACRGRR